jgi:hypothetical protein
MQYYEDRHRFQQVQLLKKRAAKLGLQRIRGMATIPELLDGHVTLEVECLDRLYLNGFMKRNTIGDARLLCTASFRS